MKVLVLHNNNVPFFLRNPECNQIDDIIFDEKLLKYDSNIETRSFDSFVSSRLDFLKESFYDIILLPFTLSEENYLEYTGLRVAVHIRLTLEWKKITTPILFIGPDSHDDVTKLSNFGSIVCSYHVFMTDIKEQDSLISTLNKIVKDYPGGDDDSHILSSSYKGFLDSLNVKAPANYATHHSIANEWAILRWIDMFDWKGMVPPELDNKELPNMLYFKYLMMMAGRRDSFSRKKKKSLGIEGIKNKRIVYIDDEEKKGWRNILSKIFESSSAYFDYYSFSELNTSLKKKELLDDIKIFLKNDYLKNGGADCYILDLRLHDDDFKIGIKTSEISGHKIARFIKDKKEMNPYNQIVIFTASNKVWNLKEEIIKIGASGYAIKESPEQNLDRGSSYLNYCDFSQSVKHACEMSYLKTYYNELKNLEYNYNYSEKDFSLLYEFIALLGVDNGEENPALLTACGIVLNSFLEMFLKERFEIKETGVLYRGVSNIAKWKGRVIFKKDEDDNIIDVMVYSNVCVPPEGWESPYYKSDVSKIIIPLSLYYNLTQPCLKKAVEMRRKRNEGAHEGVSSFTLEELNDLFYKIIKPMIVKEMELLAL